MHTAHCTLQVDYIAPILAWAAKHAEDISTPITVSAAGMATTFGELHLQLHVPYLYCHQGECEHHMIFTDVYGARSSSAQICSCPVPLGFTHLLCLKRCHACGQWHSS